jgi:UDP-glucose 4-epimerase
MRALITGGAGFIGSHLAEALLQQGEEVVVLDDLSTGKLENIAHLTAWPRFSFMVGSVTNERLVANLIDQCDVVFHLAAAVGVRLVVNAPVHTIETNVHGTETVLRQAARGKKLVVVASTSEVYGKSAVFPFREDADLVLGQPTIPRWGYAASKLIDEFLALAYWQEQQVPVIVVRFFNTVGPRQCSRYGMVIPTSFARRSPANRSMHGTAAARSFTWVGDVVGLLALQPNWRCVGQVFNIEMAPRSASASLPT